MWVAETKVLDNNIHKVSLFLGTSQLMFEDVIQHWRQNHEFREFYISILEDTTFDAFFWENPPVAKSNMKQPYEFVLVNSPQLSRVNADPGPFQDQFNSNS